MEKSDLLKPEDKVIITVYGPDNTILYKFNGEGFHNLEGAIDRAISEANLNISPEDCVFEVTNMQRDVTHKYRLNAHGHIKLIL